MENKKENVIITISGEPVSGKGTATKAMISTLKEKGLSEDKIHLISTGNIFRAYMNTIEEAIDTMIHGNEEKAEKLKQTKEFERLAKNPEFEKGIIKIVEECQKSNEKLEQFSIKEANQNEKLKDLRNIIDKIVDGDIAELGEELEQNYNEGEVWIIDSRLAFHNIPKSFSVRLTTNPRVAGERLFNDEKRGKEDKYSSVEEAIREREGRRISEINRYRKRYGVDLEDETNFDLIIDTSYSKVEDVADTILRCQSNRREGKPFSKKWTSPLTLLPLQNERMTYAKSFSLPAVSWHPLISWEPRYDHRYAKTLTSG